MINNEGLRKMFEKWPGKEVFLKVENIANSRLVSELNDLSLNGLTDLELAEYIATIPEFSEIINSLSKEVKEMSLKILNKSTSKNKIDVDLKIFMKGVSSLQEYLRSIKNSTLLPSVSKYLYTYYFTSIIDVLTDELGHFLSETKGSVKFDRTSSGKILTEEFRKLTEGLCDLNFYETKNEDWVRIFSLLENASSKDFNLMNIDVLWRDDLDKLNCLKLSIKDGDHEIKIFRNTENNFGILFSVEIKYFGKSFVLDFNVFKREFVFPKSTLSVSCFSDLYHRPGALTGKFTSVDYLSFCENLVGCVFSKLNEARKLENRNKQVPNHETIDFDNDSNKETDLDVKILNPKKVLVEKKRYQERILKPFEAEKLFTKNTTLKARVSGSHHIFRNQTETGVASYPIPFHGNDDVNPIYVKLAIKILKIDPETFWG
jgi:predicted RNA binding protein YcfA (HicA-like mRNA interferase family)